MTSALILFFFLITTRSGSALVLAGERIQFDAMLLPRYSDQQIKACSDATREGLARWAATEHGRRLIARFNSDEYRITVREDRSEPGVGRAPQPGLATLTAASDHARMKSYELVFNPLTFTLPKDMAPLPNQPVTSADVMAAAWAGEMLHLDFYSRGIGLPHHDRPDFQREWRAMATELGMPGLRHDDGDTEPYFRWRAGVGAGPLAGTGRRPR